MKCKLTSWQLPIDRSYLSTHIVGSKFRKGICRQCCCLLGPISTSSQNVVVTIIFQQGVCRVSTYAHDLLYRHHWRYFKNIMLKGRMFLNYWVTPEQKGLMQNLRRQLTVFIYYLNLMILDIHLDFYLEPTIQFIIPSEHYIM